MNEIANETNEPFDKAVGYEKADSKDANGSIFVDINARLRPPEMPFLLRECFRTIQGEWPFVGRRAVFVRAGGCNLGAKAECTFCDTDFLMSKSLEIGIPDLIRTIKAVGAKDDLIVLTGGEPGLQPAQLGQLIELMPDRQFQYESNGMFELPTALNVTTVLSPKTAGGKWYDRSKLERNINGRTFFRFVVEDKDSAYADIPPWAQTADFAQEFYGRCGISGITARKDGSEAQSLFAEGIDREQIQKNWKRAVDLTMRYGFHLSAQMHLMMGIR